MRTTVLVKCLAEDHPERTGGRLSPPSSAGQESDLRPPGGQEGPWRNRSELRAQKTGEGLVSAGVLQVGPDRPTL